MEIRPPFFITLGPRHSLDSPSVKSALKGGVLIQIPSTEIFKNPNLNELNKNSQYWRVYYPKSQSQEDQSIFPVNKKANPSSQFTLSWPSLKTDQKAD